jgi:hypothetical protein
MDSTKIKTRYGHKCIGPCYPPNTKAIHPLTLDQMTANLPFCPVVPWRASKKFPTIIFEECDKVTYKINEQQEIENLLIPIFTFDPIEFLITYYHITSLDNAVVWYYQNSEVPYLTMKRVMDCALAGYGLTELGDHEASNTIIEYIKFVILNFWFDTYINQLSPYLRIKHDKITYTNEKSNERLTDQQQIMVKNHLDVLLTNLLLTKIIKKFIKQYKNEWSTMSSYFHKLRDLTLEYIIQELNQ